jgi:hypothetical protein
MNRRCVYVHLCGTEKNSRAGRVAGAPPPPQLRSVQPWFRHLHAASVRLFRMLSACWRPLPRHSKVDTNRAGNNTCSGATEAFMCLSQPEAIYHVRKLNRIRRMNSNRLCRNGSSHERQTYSPWLFGSLSLANLIRRSFSLSPSRTLFRYLICLQIMWTHHTNNRRGSTSTDRVNRKKITNFPQINDATTFFVLFIYSTIKIRTDTSQIWNLSCESNM